MLDFSKTYKGKVSRYQLEMDLLGKPIPISWRLFYFLRLPVIPYEFWRPKIYDLMDAVFLC